MSSASPLHPDATAADHELCWQLATEVGRALLAHRERRNSEGHAGYALGAEGDRGAHVLIEQQLAGQLALGDALLSEEGHDSLDRLNHRRVWIVDPVDGTREYGEQGRTDWAVHIALAIDGQPAAGAVALPARGITLGTGDRAVTLAQVPERRPQLVVSRSRPPVSARWLQEQLEGELVPLGSAGAKAMSVVLGESDIYAHSGGQYEWDNCAPAAVALAAGLHVSRLDGTPLTYNHRDPYLPDLLICRPELADAALAALARFPSWY